MLDNMLVVDSIELYTPWNHSAPSRRPTCSSASWAGVIPRPGRYIDYGASTTTTSS